MVLETENGEVQMLTKQDSTPRIVLNGRDWVEIEVNVVPDDSVDENATVADPFIVFQQ